MLNTHRIPDLLSIGDRILVLKGGRAQGVLDAHACQLHDVERLIVRGRTEGGASTPGPSPMTGDPE